MEKEQFIRFKEDLKAKAQKQRETKAQRRTKNFKGERKMNASDATYKAANAKRELDHLYVAYYIAKHRWNFNSEETIKSKFSQEEQKALEVANKALIKAAWEKTHGRELNGNYNDVCILRNTIYHVTKTLGYYGNLK